MQLNKALGRSLTVAVLNAAALAGQSQQVGPATGLEAPWDLQKILANLVKDNEQLQPLISGLNPQQWNQKGAPGAYIQQWQLAQRQLADVAISSRLLSQKTESLPLALDLYFRLEALDVTARSLEEGAQKYGDRANADRLGELIAHDFNNRERFRDYLRDLATSNEQNFKIADEEAQRCRAMINKGPPKKSKKD
jgi:flagellar biosynthesis chaperone FliJ